MQKNYHSYHLVTYSPWPFIIGINTLSMMIGAVLFFHYSKDKLFFFGLIVTLVSMGLWFRDIIRESSFQGLHTVRVQKGLKYGMILFIVSEVLFFFSFFWAYFHSTLSPSIEIGCFWPSLGINSIDPFGVPLLNTSILLGSGATVTWAHFSIVKGDRASLILSLLITLILGFIFTLVQLTEYVNLSFCFSDGIYGSCFFLTTGFHGLHVIIGTIFLFVNLIRIFLNQLSSNHHIGFEFAIWYWHFVDVVWLFLFICVYWWGK